MTAPLTWRQETVFRFVRDYSAEHGYSPSIREIGDAADLASSSSVAWVLRQLQRKGYLYREPNRKGGLTVPPQHRLTVQVRLKDLVTVLGEAEGFIGGKDNAAFARLAEIAGVL